MAVAFGNYTLCYGESVTFSFNHLLVSGGNTIICRVHDTNIVGHYNWDWNGKWSGSYSSGATLRTQTYMSSHGSEYLNQEKTCTLTVTNNSNLTSNIELTIAFRNVVSSAGTPYSGLQYIGDTTIATVTMIPKSADPVCYKSNYLSTCYICKGSNSSLDYDDAYIKRGSDYVKQIKLGSTLIYDRSTAYVGTTGNRYYTFDASVSGSLNVSTYFPRIFAYAYDGLGNYRTLTVTPSTFTVSKNQSIYEQSHNIWIYGKDNIKYVSGGSKTSGNRTINDFWLEYYQKGITVDTDWNVNAYLLNPLRDNNYPDRGNGYGGLYGSSLILTEDDNIYLSYPFYNGENNHKVMVKCSYSVSTNPTTSPAAASTFKGIYVSSTDSNNMGTGGTGSYQVVGEWLRFSPRNNISTSKVYKPQFDYSYSYGVKSNGTVENTVSSIKRTLNLYMTPFTVLFININITVSVSKWAIGVKVGSSLYNATAASTGTSSDPPDYQWNAMENSCLLTSTNWNSTTYLNMLLNSGYIYGSLGRKCFMLWVPKEYVGDSSFGVIFAFSSSSVNTPNVQNALQVQSLASSGTNYYTYILCKVMTWQEGIWIGLGTNTL